MRIILAVAAAAFALAGCAVAGPERIEAAPPSVTYEVPSAADVTMATERAAAYCGQYGKRAALLDVVPAGGGYDANFACR